MRTNTRWVALVTVLLLSSCDGDEGRRTLLREKRVAREADGQRIGTLLHERGLIQNPEVLARAQRAAAARQRGAAAGDSTSRAFHAWLEHWVAANPDRVAEAEGVHPRPMTLEQRADQRRQMEMERRHRPELTSGTTH
jgi:hypothetical protein